MLTEIKLKELMEKVVKSIKKNGDFNALKSCVDSDGTMTDEEAFKQIVEDFSSNEVYSLLQDNLSTISSSNSIEAWDYNAIKYFTLGIDYENFVFDGTMGYMFGDEYCISVNGDLFRIKVLEVNNNFLGYENSLILDIELYDWDTSEWCFKLDVITSPKDSPLHEKYDEYFSC